MPRTVPPRRVQDQGKRRAREVPEMRGQHRRPQGKRSPPPAPVGEGFFDLGEAVRDSIGESPGSKPPVGNLIPFPAPARPAEPFAAESSSPAPESSGPGRDEVDLAFDRILSAGDETPSPSIREAEAVVPVEREAPAGPGPGPELDLGALTSTSGQRKNWTFLPRKSWSRRPENRPPSNRPRSSAGGRVPDQRFGYPGCPAGETSRRGVGGSRGSATSPWRSRPRRSTRESLAA